MALFQQIPGLTSDKLRTILEFVWSLVKDSGKGIIFAYDEAQFMADYASKEQYPLAVMLEVFQSIQRKGVRFMLVLVGLPTLVTKLVAARTYAERMFNITTLGKLDDKHSRDAILIPLKKESSSLGFTDDSVNLIIKTSDGYPYFIQFICREVFDIFIQRMNEGQSVGSVPMNEIVAKLDRDFFVARWNKATDRQKELLSLIANLDSAGGQFTIQEIVESAKKLQKPFGTSHVNQMLGTLINAGLIYKDKHGQYCFAVPLLADYIKRHPETI
jgi:hypothetical protein